MAGTLTWLGHAAFRLDTPGGKRVYVDPWLRENPSCPEHEREPERCDVVVVTHGHGDHVGDAGELLTRFGCPVLAQVELRAWIGERAGTGQDLTQALNKGGTVDAGGVKVTLTHAFHSSSTPDGTYAGEACGAVLELEDATRVFFAGDTCVFGDMALIGRIYRPDLVVLPIGDHFTMGPREAAVAVELLGARRCVPCHYGTFGLLTGTPGALRQLLPPEVELLVPEPGGSVEL